MNKFYYPVIFHKEDIGYSVWLHDISGCISQGDTFEEAVDNISDAIGLYFENYKENNIEPPKATNPCEIILEQNEFVTLICFNWIEYQHNNNK